MHAYDLKLSLLERRLRSALGGGPGPRVLGETALVPARRPYLDYGATACGAIAHGLEPGFLLDCRNREAAPAAAAAQAARIDALVRDMIYLGCDGVPRHWSLLGWIDDDPCWPLALSRDSGHVVLASGIQGCGKTVLSTILCEGSLEAQPPLASSFVLPTAYLFFHIEEHDRLPQLLDGLKPNPTERDLQLLYDRLGVQGRGIRRVRLAIPPSLLSAMLPRLLPYIDLGLEVVPLKVRLAELGQAGLEAALGMDDTRVVQRMLQEAQRLGPGLTLDGLREAVAAAGDLDAKQKRNAHARLDALEEISAAPGEAGLDALAGPGVATVFYLGGPHAERARVAPIVVGLMNGLMMPSAQHGPYQRLIVVDEVNLLAEEPVAWRAFIRAGRLVRHRGSTLVLLGQDLLCVPDELFGLAGMVAVFEQRNPALWDRLRERVGALRGWRWQDVAGLGTAEALVAATVTSDRRWRQGARRVKFRPLCCQHGGFTRAVV